MYFFIYFFSGVVQCENLVQSCLLNESNRQVSSQNQFKVFILPFFVIFSISDIGSYGVTSVFPVKQLNIKSGEKDLTISEKLLSEPFTVS